MRKLLERFWNWFLGTDKMVADFEKHFPGECLIRFYQAYGYREGYIDDPTPPPHDCPNANKRKENQVTS